MSRPAVNNAYQKGLEKGREELKELLTPTPTVLDVLKEKMEASPGKSLMSVLLGLTDDLDERSDLFYYDNDDLMELIKEGD